MEVCRCRSFAFYAEQGRTRSALYCVTVTTTVWLLTICPVVLLVVVAVILVWPADTLVTRPALEDPLPIVATLVFDEVQVTELVTSLDALRLA